MALAAASMADDDLDHMSGHIALALATGLACGLAAAGYPDVVSPSYAAIVGTLAVYPAMVGMWRHLHWPGGERPLTNEAGTRELAAPSVKQRLATIRLLFDWLVTGQVVPVNPAGSVRGPHHVVRSGQTPVLDPAEARELLDSIDISKVAGLRDRALIGLMVPIMTWGRGGTGKGEWRNSFASQRFGSRQLPYYSKSRTIASLDYEYARTWPHPQAYRGRRGKRRRERIDANDAPPL